MAIAQVCFPLTIPRNRDYLLTVYLRDFLNKPMSLVGWSGVAQVRQAPTPEAALMLDFDVNIIEPAAGKVTIAALMVDPGLCDIKGYWDLTLTNAEGQTNSYIVGTVKFINAPTEL